MIWHIADARDRDQLVTGSESGRPMFTADASKALGFRNTDEARGWILANVLTSFGRFVLICSDPDVDRRRSRPAGHYRPRC